MNKRHLPCKFGIYRILSTSIRGEHQETAGNRCIAGGRFCPVPVREAEKKTVPVPSGILNDPFPCFWPWWRASRRPRQGYSHKGRRRSGMSEQSTKDVQVKGTKRDGVFDEYDHKIHRMGRIGTFVSLITWFLPAIGITPYLQGPPGTGDGFWRLPLRLYPRLACRGFSSHLHFSHAGGGRTYLSFIFGNVPAAASMPQAVRKSWELIWGPRRGDIVATIALGISSLVSVAVCTLGMVAVTIIYPVISNPVLSPGFGNIIPALFGYMFVTVFFRQSKGSCVTLHPVPDRTCGIRSAPLPARTPCT